MKAFLLLTVGLALTAAVCPILPDTTVVYYGGLGAKPDCQLWEDNFFTWWATADARVKHQRLTAINMVSDCNLAAYPNLTLYTEPGGNAFEQQESLTAAGRQNILNFLEYNPKGVYLGTCAGWYVASQDYWWEGVQYKWANTLKLFPEVEGSITTIWDDATPPGYTVTEVAPPSNPSALRRALYWGGPTRGWVNTTRDVPGEVLLTFESIPGHLPASVHNGRTLFFSVHLEAFVAHPPPPNNDLTVAEVLANYQFRAAAINAATGKDWAIPTTYFGAKP